MKKNENFLTTGIIAEYNPFHNGHAYHLKKAKELSGADYAVAIISGDYVQRGAPAIYNKHLRTAMALQCGVDLVIEMPQVFACGSAEDFAACGIALLNSLGAIDSLCFGCEEDRLEKLDSIAKVLAREPAGYSRLLKEQLKNGASYPQARAEALVAAGYVDKADASVLSSPNNILGIEYLKALIRLDSPIKPLALRREGNGYHDQQLSRHTHFSSATAIRHALRTEDYPALKEQVPFPVYCMLDEASPLYPEDFSSLLNAALLSISHEGIPFSDFLDVPPELASRINRSLLDFGSFPERIQALKTRQYTYTRISRGLLHILLGIRTSDAVRFRKAGYAPYARILGFRKSAAPLLSRLKKSSRIPLVTKTADAVRLLEGPALDLLSQDLYGSHLYQSVFYNKYHQTPRNEYTQSVIIL